MLPIRALLTVQTKVGTLARGLDASVGEERVRAHSHAPLLPII